MTKKLMQQLKDFKELLLIISLIATFVSVVGGFAWCKVIIPEVDKRIEVKQEPILKAIEDVSSGVKGLNRSLEFQTFVQLRLVDKPTYDSIFNEYERLFPNR